MSHEAIEKHQWFVLHSEVTLVHRDSSSWFYIWKCKKKIKLCSCLLCPLIKIYLHRACSSIYSKKEKNEFLKTGEMQCQIWKWILQFEIISSAHCQNDLWDELKNILFFSRQGFSRERCCHVVTQMDQLPHQLNIDLFIEF